MGCSREELRTSIGIPFFLFCYRCCIRCWVVSFIASDRAAASVSHCTPKNSLQASVCVFSDRTMAYQQPSFIASDRAAASVIQCMPKNLLQASVCVFSDRMMAHQHLEFVAGQRVCFFLTARWRISSRNSLHTIALQHPYLVACRRRLYP